MATLLDELRVEFTMSQGGSGAVQERRVGANESI